MGEPGSTAGTPAGPPWRRTTGSAGPGGSGPGGPGGTGGTGSGRAGAAGDPRAALVEEIDAEVRRLTVEAQKLGHAFADRNGLHPTDFEALFHVMHAENRGAPLTPGELSARLGLTSGATTGVIDRLEREGHVRRDRDPADRRRIHIRYAERGAAVAMGFFGGLREPRDALMAQFTDDDLAVVRRFLAGMSDLLAAHRVSTRSEGH